MASKCIYCSRFFNPLKGQGDHVLASGLFGEFEGDSTFRGICTRCNNALGKHEQLLAQATPFGFYRQVVRPNLGRRDRGGLRRQRGASGSPAPRHTMVIHGHSFIVEPSATNPLETTVPEQIVIRSSNGIDHQIRLDPRMSEQQLLSRVNGLAIQQISSIVWDVEDRNAAQYEALFKRVFPAFKKAKESVTEPGVRQTPGRVSFEFSGAYFQAMAKIAFHYYLIHNQRSFRGNETQFAEIRQFIKRGGDKGKFFTAAGRRFKTPFGKMANGAVVPREWCHVLATDESKSVAVVYVQLFLGPQLIPSPMHVTLGRTGSLVLPNAIWGHVYQYQAGRKGRYAGRVIKASVTMRAG